MELNKDYYKTIKFLDKNVYSVYTVYIRYIHLGSDLLKIIISNSANAPIYEQIKEQIKKEIIAGNLKEGEMLPSIRQLAKELKISVITTTRAYSDLEEEGFVSNMQGKGCFVKPQNQNLIKEQILREIEDNFSQIISSAKIAKIDKNELFSIFDVLMKEENYE